MGAPPPSLGRLSPRVAAALAVVLAACTQEPVAVLVDLRSDLVAGIEVANVRSELLTRSGATVTEAVERAVTAGAPIASGLRIAEFVDVAPGSYELVVTALGPDGAEVATQRVQMSVRSPLAVTVLLTRDCAGVDCSSGAENARYCLDNRCVACPNAECVSDECSSATDCPAMNSCAAAACVGGACFYAPTGSACAPDEACHPTTGCQPSPSNAVLLMPFEAGAPYDDVSGNGVTADALGGVSPVGGGVFGGAVELDGVDGDLDIGYEPAGFFTTGTDHDETTVEAWVSLASVGGWQVVLQIGGCNNTLTLGIAPDGSPSFVTHRGGFGSEPTHRADASAPLTIGEWHHLAGVKDTSGLTLYVDGEPAATTATTDPWNSGAYGIHVGRSSSDESALREACATPDVDWYHGRVDELRVYPVALTQAQVQAHMITPIVPP